MNKIWNASKFVQTNSTKIKKKSDVKIDKFYDIWITSKFNELLLKYKSFLENCEVEKAAYEIYHFFWDDFCDWYIEIVKIHFVDQQADSEDTRLVMADILNKFLSKNV